MTSPHAGPTAGVLDRRAFVYTVVIPVYESEAVVGDSVDRVVEVFETAGLSYEIILVNDGSRDGSWDVIAGRGPRQPTHRGAEPAAQLRPAQRQPRRFP